MKILQLVALLLFSSFVGYNVVWDSLSDQDWAKECPCTEPISNFIVGDSSYPTGNRALLASRFDSLKDLKKIIQIEYSPLLSPSDSNYNGDSKVLLRHCSNGMEVVSVLASGISQGDIAGAEHGSFGDRVWLLTNSPFAVANRIDLIKVFRLARRRSYVYGEGDVAFYDLAQKSVENINTPKLAYLHPRDSSEKGYINSFNHITAQAIITSCFSEELADFLADVHERHSMPELTTGLFSQKQLTDPDKNPVDNYVDMVNNEWGQEIGKKLREKFNISPTTYWTPELLADYLNELQSYYSWAFQIGFKPLRPRDEMIVKFSRKINRVMKGDLG